MLVDGDHSLFASARSALSAVSLNAVKSGVGSACSASSAFDVVGWQTRSQNRPGISSQASCPVRYNRRVSRDIGGRSRIGLVGDSGCFGRVSCPDMADRKEEKLW